MTDTERDPNELPRFVDMIEYRRKGKRGRNSKITMEMIQDAALAISKGCTVKDASALIGIPERTWFRWRARGDRLLRYIEDCEERGEVPSLREDDELYIEFNDQITMALPYRKLELRQIIEKAADKNWTAAAWMLERQYPDEYSRQVKVEHSWENELIPLIQGGDVTFEMIMEKTDEQTARRLFVAAGKEIPETISGDGDY
jgi:hypothetical protein